MSAQVLEGRALAKEIRAALARRVTDFAAANGRYPCLAAIVVTQVVNVFLCRSGRDSALAFGFFSNPLILWGVATEIALILLIVYTPWGNAVFGTAPLAADVWLFVLPFAAVMFAAEEMRKRVVRRRSNAIGADHGATRVRM